MEAIKSGFNALMHSLSPVGLINEENYSGEQADRESLRSIEEYYQESNQKWIEPDPWRSN